MNPVADSIRRGLQEAMAYAKRAADPSAYRVHVPEPVDVKVIRQKLGMTQKVFAARFGFRLNTLRDGRPATPDPAHPGVWPLASAV